MFPGRSILGPFDQKLLDSKSGVSFQLAFFRPSQAGSLRHCRGVGELQGLSGEKKFLKLRIIHLTLIDGTSKLMACEFSGALGSEMGDRRRWECH